MMGSFKWYFASIFAMTSGGSVRSPVNGLPGARRIMKKEIVIRINSVGIASRQRRKINFNIARTFWRVPIECDE
jgi:hypothetical protein